VHNMASTPQIILSMRMLPFLSSAAEAQAAAAARLHPPNCPRDPCRIIRAAGRLADGKLAQAEGRRYADSAIYACGSRCSVVEGIHQRCSDVGMTRGHDHAVPAVSEAIPQAMRFSVPQSFQPQTKQERDFSSGDEHGRRPKLSSCLLPNLHSLAQIGRAKFSTWSATCASMRQRRAPKSALAEVPKFSGPIRPRQIKGDENEKA
jgi:hypothetical protein